MRGSERRAHPKEKYGEAKAAAYGLDARTGWSEEAGPSYLEAKPIRESNELDQLELELSEAFKIY